MDAQLKKAYFTQTLFLLINIIGIPLVFYLNWIYFSSWAFAFILILELAYYICFVFLSITGTFQYNLSKTAYYNIGDSLKKCYIKVSTNMDNNRKSNNDNDYVFSYYKPIWIGFSLIGTSEKIGDYYTQEDISRVIKYDMKQYEERVYKENSRKRIENKLKAWDGIGTDRVDLLRDKNLDELIK